VRRLRARGGLGVIDPGWDLGDGCVLGDGQELRMGRQSVVVEALDPITGGELGDAGSCLDDLAGEIGPRDG
jgi:hypothetical protein